MDNRSNVRSIPALEHKLTVWGCTPFSCLEYLCDTCSQAKRCYTVCSGIEQVFLCIGVRVANYQMPRLCGIIHSINHTFTLDG